MGENERLREENEALRRNQAKLESLLEAVQTDCLFAHQHIAAIQAEHNIKKKDKQKRSNTKAEWLTDEEYRKTKAAEKAEREKKEEEARVAKERKETEGRRRQGIRNERAVKGEFTGLVTGKKSKDDLKDIAQALCLDLGGKNQELADRINKYLDESPNLKDDKRFQGLFTARTRSKPDPKKRKQPAPATSDRGQDDIGEGSTGPTSQKPRLQ